MAGHTGPHWQLPPSTKAAAAAEEAETGQRVKAEPPPERNLVSSVAELMKEGKEGTERVEWARILPTHSGQSRQASAIFLAIGLARGYQIWSLGAHGECEELISDRQGPVKLIRLLPEPDKSKKDKFPKARPILALVDSVSAVAGRQHSSLSFLSLSSGEHLPPLSFPQAISALHVSANFLVLSFPDGLSVCDAGSLSPLFNLQSSGHWEDGVPTALGTSWLAFADSGLRGSLESRGGASAEAVFPAYAAHLISAAANLRSTVSSLSDSLRASPAPSHAQTSAASPSQALTIIHPSHWKPGQTDVHSMPRPAADEPVPVLFHFVALRDQPIRSVAFSASSDLCVVGAESGQYLNVFALRPHPGGSPLAEAAHLYTLFRGTTPATLLHVALSRDSRWVAASTNHGTTHVFPITPYGGPLTLRTHGGAGIVNRQSRFHRSAGIDARLKVEVAEPSPPAKTSPLSANSLGRAVSVAGGSGGGGGGPLLVQAAAKLHQQLLPAGVGSWAGELSEGLVSKRRSSVGGGSGSETGGGSVAFGEPRVSPVGPGRYLSLFLLHGSGAELSEYGLELSGSGPPGSDAPFTLSLHPSASWTLTRTKSSPDIRAPLSKANPLRQLALSTTSHSSSATPKEEDWISEVELAAYQSPSRRLWQGPQFTFRTFLPASEAKAAKAEKADVSGQDDASPQTPSRSGSGKAKGKGRKALKATKVPTPESPLGSESPRATEPARTAPMCIGRGMGRGGGGVGGGREGERVPVVLEAGSVGSWEPGVGVTTELCGSWAASDHLNPAEVDGRLRESIADAMRTASLKGSSCGDSDMEDARDSFSDNDSTLIHSLQP